MTTKESSMLGRFAAALAAGCAIFAGLAWVRTADAVPPDPKATALAALAAATKIYAFLPLAQREGRGDDGETTWGALHIQVAQRKLAFDGPGFRYRYANGQTTFHNAQIGRSHPAMPLAAADPMVNGLLTQVDSGFATATWVQQSPPAGVHPSLRNHPGQAWWKVNLPAAWDDPYRIYFQFSASGACTIPQVAVLYADEDRIVEVRNPVGGEGAIALQFPLCKALVYEPTFGQTAYGPFDPFASTLFLQRTLHRDEYGGSGT